MGKGSRKRISYQESIAAKQEKLEQENKEKKRNRIIYIIVFAICFLVIFGTFGGHFLSEKLKDNGTMLRKQTIIESDHYKVDGAMMTYFINLEYNNYSKENADKLEDLGLDISKDLKEQTCTLDESNQTWYSYFANKAQNSVQKLLVVAEAAMNDGFELSEDDNKAIQKDLDSIEEDAKSANLEVSEYLKTNFGRGVLSSDIEEAIKLQRISTSYKEYYKNSIKLSNDDLKDYFKNNGKFFNACDYYTITFVSSIEDDMTKEQIKSYNESSLKWAQGLAACDSVEAFDKYLYSYFQKYYEERNQEYTEDMIQEQIDTTAQVIKGFTYTDNELGNWALDNNREVGDTKIIEGNNQYEVYMIVKAPYTNIYNTRSLRAIWLSSETYTNITNANTKARELLAQWKKGDMSEESFSKIAKENTDDKVAKQKGGLMDNCLREDLDESLTDWLFDDSREEGDYSIIKQGEDGYYIAYYLGEGLSSWQIIAKEHAQNDKYDSEFINWQKTYKTDTNAVKLDKLLKE